MERNKYSQTMYEFVEIVIMFSLFLGFCSRVEGNCGGIGTSRGHCHLKWKESIAKNGSIDTFPSLGVMYNSPQDLKQVRQIKIQNDELKKKNAELAVCFICNIGGSCFFFHRTRGRE